MRNERLIEREVSVNLETKYGNFEVVAYRQITTDDIHLAIKCGHWLPDDPLLVRVHSSTETGEILGSLFDDYGLHLQKAIEKISEEGRGVLLYMRHGEKSDAILHRLESYRKKEERGENVVLEKKEEMTQRDYGVGAQILRDLGISKIRLISNHPRRRIGLIGYGLEIVENIEL